MLPPPSLLQGFDDVLPGTAKRILELAVAESEHRRTLELSITQGNIAAQQANSQLISNQAKHSAFNDTLGQTLGFVTCLSCIAASVYTAINGHELLALALAAIPTAAVIKAYFIKK
jgi:uncharacterized membrane protein